MKVACFDLDDTLYKEIDYLYEAYRLIAVRLWGDEWEVWFHQMQKWYDAGENVFARICDLRPDTTIETLLSIYRYEVNSLTLPSDSNQILSQLKDKGIKLGLITDGREITQQNKIRALALNQYFEDDMIIISESFGSEKTSLRNFQYFMDKYPDCHDFTYIGDNPSKDFIAPNSLGWNTICLLDNGRNIHKQNFSLDSSFLPQHTVISVSDLQYIQ